MTPRSDEPQTTFAPARVTLLVVLGAIVNALGGPKRVGGWLRPQMSAERARTWCANCLDPTRREQFHPDDIEKLFHRAREVGFHDGKQALDRLLGYHPTQPMTPTEEKEDLMQRIAAGMAQQQEWSRRVEGLLVQLGEVSAKQGAK